MKIKWSELAMIPTKEPCFLFGVLAKNRIPRDREVNPPATRRTILSNRDPAAKQ